MRLSLFAAAALCVSSLAAHADGVQLNVKGIYAPLVFDFSSAVVPASSGGGSFYLDATDQISQKTYELGFAQVGNLYDFGIGPPPNLLVEIVPGIFHQADPDGLIAIGEGYGILFTGSDTMPVFNTGTYTNLTITDIPSSITPEPSSFALLGTGMLGVAGVMRKRFA